MNYNIDLKQRRTYNKQALRTGKEIDSLLGELSPSAKKKNIGSRALRDFIERNSDKVRAVISGHAHLQGGKYTELNTTCVINCASHDDYNVK